MRAANNETSNNRGSELRKKALRSEVSWMYMGRSDRHLQMMGGRLYRSRETVKEKQNHVNVN
jgi:hypothetical protein